MSNPARRRGVHHDQLPHSTGVLESRSIKRCQLATQRRRLRQIDADMDQFFSSAGIPGEEIYCQIPLRFYGGDIGAAATLPFVGCGHSGQQE